MALVPADWEAAESFFQYPLVVKLRDGKPTVAQPVKRELSRSGLRGVWFYNMDDVDVLIYLRQTCDIFGRHRWIEKSRCYLTPESCEKVVAAVEETWKRYGDVDDVIRAVSPLVEEP
jgi:hypothetical protein